MKVSINRLVRPFTKEESKAYPATDAWNLGFKTEEVQNIAEIIDLAANGRYGIAGATFDAGDGRKVTQNFTGAQVLVFDLDMCDPRFMYNDPRLTEYESGYYETLSSTPAAPKGRVLFALDWFETSGEKFTEILQAFAWRFGEYKLDMSGTRVAQGFFGSHNRPYEFRAGKRFSKLEVHQLTQDFQASLAAKPQNKQSKKSADEIEKLYAQYRKTYTVEVVRDMLSYVPPRTPDGSEWLLNDDEFFPMVWRLQKLLGPQIAGEVLNEWLFRFPVPGSQRDAVKKAHQQSAHEYGYLFEGFISLCKSYGWLGINKANKRHVFKLTPDLRLNQRYLDVNDLAIPEGKKVVLIKAPKGTGKTETIKRLLISRGQAALLPVNTRALAKNIAERLNGVYYKDDSPQEGRSYACTYNNLAVIDTKGPKFPVLVLDEVEQGISYLLTGEPMRTLGHSAFEQLIYRFKNAELVVMMDADLGETAVMMAEELLKEEGYANPREAMWIVENVYAVRDEHTAYMHTNVETLLHELKRALETGLRVAISYNSKRQGDQLFKWVETTFPDKVVKYISSETNKSEDGKALLNNVNAILEADNVDVLITTPAMVSGFSIDLEWFDEVFGAFENGPDSQTYCSALQHLSRVRHIKSKTVHIYASVTQIDGSLDLDYIMSTQVELMNKTLAGMREYDEYGNVTLSRHDTIWMNLVAIITYNVNYSNAYFRTLLERGLKAEGYTVKRWQGDASDMAGVRTELRDAANTADLERAQEVAAVDITDMTYERYDFLVSQEELLTPEEKLQVKKYEIAEFYALSSAEITPSVVLADAVREFRSCINLLEVATSFADGATLDKEERVMIKDENGILHFSLKPNWHKHHQSKAELVQEVLALTPLGRLPDLKSQSINDEALLKWAETKFRSADLVSTGLDKWLSRPDNRLKLEALFGYRVAVAANGTVPKNEPMRVVSYVLAYVGLLLEQVKRSRQGREYGIAKSGAEFIQKTLYRREEKRAKLAAALEKLAKGEAQVVWHAPFGQAEGREARYVATEEVFDIVDLDILRGFSK